VGEGGKERARERAKEREREREREIIGSYKDRLHVQIRYCAGLGHPIETYVACVCVCVCVCVCGCVCVHARMCVCVCHLFALAQQPTDRI